MEKPIILPNWQYFYNGYYFEVRGEVLSHPNVSVFATSKEDHPDFSPEDLCEKDQAEVYARLIAAAPKMLEALESLDNEDLNLPYPVWDLVRDAIELARG